MTQPKIKFTYRDYATAPEDKRYELLDGDLLMVPAPTTYHQRLSRRLFVRLEEFVASRRLGEVFYAPCDVVLTDHDVVQPDLLFVSNERSHIVTADNIQGGTWWWRSFPRPRRTETRDTSGLFTPDMASESTGLRSPKQGRLRPSWRAESSL